MGDEDKQFDATPRKLEQARKEGQVVKSKDFSTAISLLVLFTAINGLAPLFGNKLPNYLFFCTSKYQMRILIQLVCLIF